MEWNDRYKIGVEHIDRQHKGLFTAVNRIQRILAEQDVRRSRLVCEEAVKYLKSYTLEHFSDEEAYQLEIGYEGYETHKRLHDDFVTAVLEREKEMVENDFAAPAVRRFTDMAQAWLVNHIMNADQAIVRDI